MHCTLRRSVYLVFEYIGGGDLARVLDTMDAPFQLSHAKALVRQLLKACEFLHNRWIVHRDLKLSNLLVDDKYASFFICIWSGLASLHATEVRCCAAAGC